MGQHLWPLQQTSLSISGWYWYTHMCAPTTHAPSAGSSVALQQSKLFTYWFGHWPASREESPRFVGGEAKHVVESRESIALASFHRFAQTKGWLCKIPDYWWSAGLPELNSQATRTE